jgi:hypothetical protein
MGQTLYADGLGVNWTPKELERIREIKQRWPTSRPRNIEVELDMFRARRKELAIQMLYRTGYFSTSDIAEMFNISQPSAVRFIHQEEVG